MSHKVLCAAQSECACERRAGPMRHAERCRRSTPRVGTHGACRRAAWRRRRRAAEDAKGQRKRRRASETSAIT
jgi:hypothetical protein